MERGQGAAWCGGGVGPWAECDRDVPEQEEETTQSIVPPEVVTVFEQEEDVAEPISVIEVLPVLGQAEEVAQPIFPIAAAQVLPSKHSIVVEATPVTDDLEM